MEAALSRGLVMLWMLFLLMVGVLSGPLAVAGGLGVRCWSGGGVDCLGAGPRRSGAGEAASFARPGEGRLRGLPRYLAAAAAFADLFGHGPAFGDDLLGFGGGGGVAVVVADHIRGAAVQDGPGPFGEVPGDDAAGLEVVGAAFGHLGVVDLGELGVLAAGGVGGAVERGAQQGGSGLAHGLALAVGLAGFAGLGGEPDVGLELRSVPEPAGAADGGDQDRGADLGEPGQRPGQLVWVGPQIVLLAGGGVGGQLGLDGAQQPDLGGGLGGQFGERHRRVVLVKLGGCGCGVAPLPGAVVPLLVV